MDELHAVLEKLLPDTELDTELRLISDHVLDSIAFVTMVSGLSEHYGIDIPFEDMLPENFDTVESIYKLVTRVKSAMT